MVAGADLLVVEGGLNDWDRSDTEIRAGFARLMRVARAAGVDAHGRGRTGERTLPRCEGPARRRAARGSCRSSTASATSSTADLDLPYLDDDLHLTATGHRLFGDAVASRLAALG